MSKGKWKKKKKRSIRCKFCDKVFSARHARRTFCTMKCRVYYFRKLRHTEIVDMKNNKEYLNHYIDDRQKVLERQMEHVNSILSF